MTEKSKVVHYLRADVYQVLTKKETWLSVLGVTLSMFFALESPEELENSVIDTLLYSAYGVGFKLSFVFCVLPFGTAFCEELENHYIKYVLIRGNLKKYAVSKAIVIFLASVAVMAMGVLMFAIICSFKMPWIEVESYDSDVAYKSLLANNHYVVWVAVYGVQWGIFAGCLSLASAFCSLYISNRLLLLAMPVLICQIITELGTGNFRQIVWLNPHIVFDARYRIFGSDSKTFLWALVSGLAVATAFGTFSYIRLRKRM